MEEVNRLYLWIGYILLSLVVFSIILFALNDFANGDRVYTDKFSNEFSLINSAILTSNGNLIVEYLLEEKNKEYDLIIKSDCESVVNPSGRRGTYKSIYCLNNEFVKIIENKINLDKIRFEFKDDNFNMKEIKNGISS